MIKFIQYVKGILLRKEAAPISYSSTNEGGVYNNNNTELRTQINGADRAVISDTGTHTLTNKTIDADSNTITNIDNNEIKAGAAIDASKIADGSVSSTEFQYINSLTSNVQTQLNATASSASLTAHTGASTGVHGVAGSVVGTTDAQSLTNKTINAASNTITNISNAEIKAGAAIDASKIADGTVSSAEFQFLGNVTSDVQTQLNARITASSTDTLTNKSISGDTNTVTNLAITAIKTNLTDASKFMVRDASGVPTSSTKAVPSGVVVGDSDSQSLTNKNLASSTNTLSGAMATSFTNSGTVTLPAATTTLVGRDTTDTLTLKTLTSPAINTPNLNGGTASNTSRILLPTETTTNLSGLTNTAGVLAFDSTLNKPVFNNGSGFISVGSGSSSDVNYLSANSDAEQGVVGFATYADAAGVTPVDATGGSPTVTFTRTTSTPLRGTGSFLFTKDAANRQGQGASYAFTIDSADKAKVLSITFDYAIASGTYAGSPTSLPADLTVYIYDVTNSLIIQPASYSILNATVDLPQKFIGTFQTASNSTSYRLAFHVATTSASAYTVKMDNLRVGPQIVEYGAPVTDWVSYTPVIRGNTNQSAFTNSPIVGAYRRIGDSIEIDVDCLFSGLPATGTGPFEIGLPSGLTVDLTKRPLSNSWQVGYGRFNRGSATSIDTVLIPIIDSSLATVATGFFILGVSGSAAAFSTTNPNTIASGDRFSARVIVPVTGFSSTVQMSSDTDTRVVAEELTLAGGVAITGGAAAVIFKFDTVANSTHGAYSTTTGLFTAPVPGWYDFDIGLRSTSAAWTATDNFFAYLYKNGSQYSTIASKVFYTTNTHRFTVTGSKGTYLKAGDTISIFATSDRTINFNDGSAFNWLDIARRSGPAAIAASESVNASYYSSANSTSSTTQTINFDTKLYDTHNAVTAAAAGTGTWKFTAPIAGKYSFKGVVLGGGSTGGYINIYKNGTGFAHCGSFTFNATGIALFNYEISLIAGDFIDIRTAASTSTAGGALTLANDVTQIMISRIGN